MSTVRPGQIKWTFTWPLRTSVASSAGSVKFAVVTPGSAVPSPGAITLPASFAGFLKAFIQIVPRHSGYKTLPKKQDGEHVYQRA